MRAEGIEEQLTFKVLKKLCEQAQRYAEDQESEDDEPCPHAADPQSSTECGIKTGVLDDLVNWKNGTTSTKMRQTSDDIHRLMWEGAEEIERLRAALKSAGDDYPGSSFQRWCYDQAGIPLSASPSVGEVMQNISVERDITVPNAHGEKS
jgi:hypothetical protein